MRAEILQQDWHDRHKSRHLPIELRGDEEELSLRGYSPQKGLKGVILSSLLEQAALRCLLPLKRLRRVISKNLTIYIISASSVSLLSFLDQRLHTDSII